MSVINKMLADLEARQNPSPVGDTSPNTFYQGLRPVNGARKRLRRRRLLVGLVVLAVVAAGLFVGERWGAATVPLEAVNWGKATLKQLALTSPTAASTKQWEGVPIAHGTTVANTPRVSVAETERMNVEALAHPLTTSVASASPPNAPVEPKQTNEKKQPNKAAKPKVKEKSRALKKKTAMSKGSRRDTKKQARSPKKTGVASAENKASQTGPSPEQVVVEKKARPMTAEDQADIAYEQGASSLKEKHFAKAEKKLDLALAKNPRHVEARELLVGLLLQGGRWSEAEELLQVGRNTVPEHYRFAQLLARIYVQRGTEDKALPLMEDALGYAKADSEFLGFLATLYQRAERHEEAIKTYSRAITLQPHHSQWWLGLGISLEAESKWEAARKAYTRAINGRGLNKTLVQYAQQRLAFTRSKVASSK